MNVKFPLLCLFLTTSMTYSQSQRAKPGMLPDSPLSQLTRSFPQSIEFKKHGHLIEFCPDNTCDAFLSQAGVSQSALEDLAYLYEFYFSGFADLEDWRAEDGAKAAAEQILARPEYRHCHAGKGRIAARCVMKEVGGRGRVRLLYVRYDEQQRKVTPGNLIEELSRPN